MADTPKKPEAPKAEKQIAVLDPQGRFGTIPESQRDQLPPDARVLTPKEAAAKEEEIATEAAEKRVQERYDALPTWRKAAGIAGTALNTITPLTIGANPDAPPPIAAFGAGVVDGGTGGLAHGVTRQIVDATAGHEAGERYAQQVEDQKLANPTAHTIGSTAGMLGSAVLGEANAARGLPGSGIASLGSAAEKQAGKAIVRAIGGAPTSALGRAGVAAAESGVRGLVEGGLYGAGEYTGDSLLRDQKMTTDKFFAATGLGALYGTGAGAIFGGGASLVGSGYAAGRSKFADMLSGGANDATTRAAAASTLREVRLATDTLDAGLREHVAAENPFDFGTGAEHRPVQLRPDVGQRGAVPLEQPFSISKRVTIDPDAGLRVSEARDFAERMASGERLESSADIQFYRNNAKAVEAELHNIANEQGAAIHPTGKGRYSTQTERVPISDIDVPEVWDPTKLADLRAKRAAGVELDPIRLGVMDPEMQAKTGKRFAINDGIHRTHVALERGEGDILAKYEVGEYPQKLNNDVFSAKKPIDVGAGGVNMNAHGVTFDPEAGIVARGAGGRFQGAIPATDAMKLSSARNVPREVMLREGIDAAAIDAARNPVGIPAVEGAPSAVQTGAAFRKQPRDVRGLANELAFDALGATKTQARGALEHVGRDAEDAKRAVGEYVNRAILNPATDGATGVKGLYRAAAEGRADDLYNAIRADKAGRIANGISGAVKGTPARMSVLDLQKKAFATYNEMLRDPTKVAGAEAFYKRIDAEIGAIYRAGKVAQDGTIDAADAYYIRSGLEHQAYEVRNTSGAAGDAYKGFLRDWDKASVEALDDAAKKAGKSGLADNIRYWKREWQLASAAEEAAKGGAERISNNNMFGIRESIAAGVGLATAAQSDDPMANVAASLGVLVGGKLLRERGAALAARALTQLSDHGVLSRIVKRTTNQLERSANGLIVSPEAAKTMAKGRIEKLSTSDGRKLAVSTIARIAAFQNDPDEFMDRASKDVASLATHSPELADAIVQRRVQAMIFLSSKIPDQGSPDPLDPHPKLNLTPIEERSLALYAWYTDKPERFFVEVEHGKLTVEGADTAKELLPDAFAELQALTSERLTTQLARGNRLPFRQRQLLGQVLDFAATPSQRPDHRAFLQACADGSMPVNDTLPANMVSHGRRRGPGGVGAATIGASPLDALEAGGIGRRRR